MAGLGQLSARERSGGLLKTGDSLSGRCLLSVSGRLLHLDLMKRHWTIPVPLSAFSRLKEQNECRGVESAASQISGPPGEVLSTMMQMIADTLQRIKECAPLLLA